jgi:hypothetical protein
MRRTVAVVTGAPASARVDRIERGSYDRAFTDAQVS